MKAYEVCVAMFPILGVRLRFYYDLFTVACINGLPTRENSPPNVFIESSHKHKSVCLFVLLLLLFFSFFVYFVEKGWR